MPDAVALSFTVIRSPAWKSNLIQLLLIGVRFEASEEIFVSKTTQTYR